MTNEKCAYLVWRAVLDNLSTQVTAFDRAEILLVRFAIAGILVQNVRGSSFNLWLHDSKPELLRLHFLLVTSFSLISD